MEQGFKWTTITDTQIGFVDKKQDINRPHTGAVLRQLLTRLRDNYLLQNVMTNN